MGIKASGGYQNGLIAVSVGACVVATAGVCGAVAVATAIGSGAVSGVSSYVQYRSTVRAVGVTLASTAVGLVGLRKVKVFGKALNKGVPRAVRWFGKNRNYRSFAVAIRKAPAKKRLARVSTWGAFRFGINYLWNRRPSWLR